MGLIIDGTIIVLYFCLISAIGLYMGRREKSLLDFALGGRGVPWWAVMASIIAAETSAATFLGAPEEGFSKQTLAYVQLAFGAILGRYVVANFFLKPYYDYKVYTVYDYLGARFGPSTKNLVSALFLVMRTLASGTRLFIPSLVMVLAWKLFTEHGKSVVYGQDAVHGVIPYLVAIISLTILTCIYTAKGGIKAVIWTDVAQATLMFGSALVVVFMLFSQIGGVGAFLKAVPDMRTLHGYFVTGFEPSTIHAWQKDEHLAVGSPMTWWDTLKLIFTGDYTIFSALVGATAQNMAAFGTDQDMVQRLLTSETQAKARRSLLTAAWMDIPIATVFTLIGILLFVYYKQDPTFKPANNDDVFGSYILNVLPVGIRGLVLAGVFATAMGSLSAALNSLATSATNDWYIPFYAKPRALGEDRIVRAAKWFTLLFAFLMVVVAGIFAYIQVKDSTLRIIPVVLGIAGYILGPMLGVFLLGMFTKRRGSDRGNMIAIVAGLLTTSFLGDLPGKIWPALSVKSLRVPYFGPGMQILGWRPLALPDISFAWYALIGAVAVLVIGLLFTTPPAVLASAKQREEQADSGEDVPMALRT